MGMTCFRTQGSDAVCGIHNVPLLRSEAILDKLAPTLGRIVYFVCPEGRQVVNNENGSLTTAKES